MKTNLYRPLTLLLITAAALNACGKSVERESTGTTNPPATVANNGSTLTIPTTTTPTVFQVPVSPPPLGHPGEKPPHPPRDLGDDSGDHSSDDQNGPGLPGDWFTRPVVYGSDHSGGGHGCKPNCDCQGTVLDDVELVRTSMTEIIARQAIGEIETQQTILIQEGYRRSDSEIRVKYEGDSCTSFTSRCDEKNHCTERRVCGRGYLVVSPFTAVKNTDSADTKPSPERAVGVRMIVSPQKRDAIVSKVLTQNDLTWVDLKASQGPTSQVTSGTIIKVEQKVEEVKDPNAKI